MDNRIMSIVRTATIFAVLIVGLCVGLYISPTTVEASYQPFSFITPLTAQSGNLGTTTVFTAPSSSYYVLSIYMSTASAVSLSTSTLTLIFTEGGVVRNVIMPSLSLGTTTNALAQYQCIKADAGTAIQISVAAIGIGTYNVHIGWKQQSS